MLDDREPAEPLTVPQTLPADHWLVGFKHGYQKQRAQPPGDATDAAQYRKGYREGKTARARADRVNARLVKPG